MKSKQKQVSVVPPKIIDKEAWDLIDDIWYKHNVKKQETFTLRLGTTGRNHNRSYIVTLKEVNKIDDEQPLIYTNETDETNN